MSPAEIILEFINEKIWLAVFIGLLFICSCARKPHFPLKAAGGIASLIILGLLPRILYEIMPENPLLSFWMMNELLLWPILMALYMGFVFRCNWNMMLLAALAGLCTQETMFGLWAFFQILIPAAGTLWGELLVCAGIAMCFAVMLHYFLGVKITPRSLQVLQQRSLLPLLALYALSTFLVSSSSYVALTFVLFFARIQDAFLQAGLPLSVARLRISGIFVNVTGNLMVLLALRNMLRYSETDLERELLEQIREQDRKQYVRFRDSVDYINTKSHDLKHYLSLLQRSEKLPEQELHQVSESIQRLDSEIDSGNETLDLILTDRRLICEGKGINLIFQTDGTRLEHLDVIDTYTIFCNVLDNAMEYVNQLPEGERQIHLGIRTIHGMVFIHQENQLNAALEIKDGLPRSTQPDPLLHGFGLKSVQNTVKKQGGELAIRAEDGRFELDICFPLGAVPK